MARTRYVVEGGVVRHAHGVLPARLEGGERLDAHVTLMRCAFELADYRCTTNPALRALDLFRRDPSLLLESIPDRYPLQRTERETYVNADAVWKNYASWYGSWIARYQSDGCVDVVEYAMEAGLHPDDEKVWNDGPLLSDSEWPLTARNVASVLRYGASPCPTNETFGNSHLTRALGLVKSRVNDKSDEELLVDAVHCVELLLEAQPDRVDPRAPDGSLPFGTGSLVIATLGLLADTALVRDYEEPLARRVRALFGRLVDAGADLNTPSGLFGLTPVVQCLRALNIEGACELIRLGCRTDVEAVPRPGRTGQVESLMDEAFKAGGEDYRAELRAAMMRRDIASTSSAPGNTLAPSVRRRRAGVV